MLFILCRAPLKTTSLWCGLLVKISIIIIINSALKISNMDSSQSPKEISIDHRLANFLGIGRTLKKEEYIKKLNSSSCFFISCNLTDPRKNFFNGKKSNLLAKVDVRGKPFAVTLPGTSCWASALTWVSSVFLVFPFAPLSIASFAWSVFRFLAFSTVAFVS